MADVWVLYCMDYEDSYIAGVYSSKEKALETFSFDPLPAYNNAKWDIEEVSPDKLYISFLEQNWKDYSLTKWSVDG